MALPRVFTFSDAIDSLEDFSRGQIQSTASRVLRRCIRMAYEEIVAAYDWSFLYVTSRIQLKAVQTTGTVVFDLTGGTYERELTLTDATWPDWAVDGAVRFGDIVCDIDSVKSDTVVTLDATMCPGADVASTSYTLYPRWYALPPDFMSSFRPLGESAWRIGQYIPPNDMLMLDRYRDSTGEIEWYTIGTVADLYGSMALLIHPPAATAESLDFLYKKRPREIRYTGQQANDYAGTIAVVAASATVTGTDTAFASGMVGSILRIGTDTNRPTGLEGDHPYAEQRSISDVASATELTLDAAVSTSRSGVKCSISDPIDLDVAGYDAFLRLSEKNWAITANLKNKAEIIAVAQKALFDAKAGDHRIEERRIAGQPTTYITRLADATSRPDVG